MTTPNSVPSQARQLPNRPPSTDSAVQANANKSEAKVRGVDQDQTPTASADVATGVAALKNSITNPPGQEFTWEYLTC